MKNLFFLFVLSFILFQVWSCKYHNKAQESRLSPEELASAGRNIEQLNPETFKEKVFDYTKQDYNFVGEEPCIIDFYANWCGPCKLMAPSLQAASEKYKGKIKIYKVDVDVQTKLSMDFSIKGIPALLFCPKTGSPQFKTGLISKEDLEKYIQTLLLN